ncbi:group III truncated hemoglobin [Labrys portucalensis]|uniref:Group III truncated hemoglobin n=1 Tax=Labrys neptuniae TaxID=376174 RepID=A0ABV6ZEV9_9HYPH|nr:group III truncated hemoglobin [Labrys neptuniae]MDT3377258.1 group III truncated hemoglobin [Labrys neptuniae]
MAASIHMSEPEGTAISEAMIERLVHTFYGRVRQDDLIGPIFNAKVADWDDHLAKLCAFWSSVILRSGRYDGRPLRPHLMLPLEGRHFDRWLDLFERTSLDVLPRNAALLFIDRARRIADSFEMSIGTQHGEIRPPRHQARRLPT